MRQAAICSVFLTCATSAALGQPCDPNAPIVSLYDLGPSLYKTFEGGLYAGGSNQRPAPHEAAGVAIARSIVPLDSLGQPASNGRIVLISIGFSNMTQEWNTGAVGDPGSIPFTFTARCQPLQSSGEINPRVLIVDGAQGGQTANNWGAEPPNTTAAPWSVALTRLAAASASAAQVQIACVKTANASPTQCIANNGSSRGDAGLLAAQFAGIARNLKVVFPNIKLAYFVSRTYAGYALSNLNPEPFAYESGFGVKWMIASQIDHSGAYGNLNFDPAGGPVVAPWLSWGAYVWAHGTTPNGLGISWTIDDFRTDDRTHPARGAINKVGTAFLSFFLSDTTTRPWFGYQCLRGDMDNSGVVDAADIRGFVQVLLESGSATVAQRCHADVDNDGVVQATDVPIFTSMLLSS